MKKVLLILLVGFTLVSCGTSQLFKEYKLYNRDQYFNYPKAEIKIKFNNDTTGLLVNSDVGREPFMQGFIFSKVKDEFLIIEKVNKINNDLISFKPGDTVVVAKRRLYFFYAENKKYLLSFKKQ